VAVKWWGPERTKRLRRPEAQQALPASRRLGQANAEDPDRRQSRPRRWGMCQRVSQAAELAQVRAIRAVFTLRLAERSLEDAHALMVRGQREDLERAGCLRVCGREALGLRVVGWDRNRRSDGFLVHQRQPGIEIAPPTPGDR
jgi:hypothetical protein